MSSARGSTLEVGDEGIARGSKRESGFAPSVTEGRLRGSGRSADGRSEPNRTKSERPSRRADDPCRLLPDGPWHQYRTSTLVRFSTSILPVIGLTRATRNRSGTPPYTYRPEIAAAYSSMYH